MKTILGIVCSVAFAMCDNYTFSVEGSYRGASVKVTGDGKTMNTSLNLDGKTFLR